jgi:CSLREA domain-containing protein
MNRRRLAVALALPALSLCSATAHASVTVTTTTDELTAANGNCSLREAITLLDGDDTTARGCTNTAADPTTINVPAKADPYKLTIHGTTNDTNTTGDLDLYRDMTIAGAGAASTVIDGDNADRVFDIYRNDPAKDPNPTVTISGVTITNGHAPSQAGVSANGGGIEVYDNTSSLTLNSDVVTANGAGSPPGEVGGGGGGIYCGGPLALNSTSVDHNFAGQGGDATHPGGSGGGLYCTVPFNITNSTIAANGAGNGGSTSGSGGAGGGIYTGVGGGTIVASTISGNGAGTGHSNVGGSGGGIIGGGLTVTNSTIANNAAGDSVGGQAGGGGGLFSVGNTLTNDTIVGNAAGAGIGSGSSSGVGGGFYSNNDVVANTIIASNAGGNCVASNLTNNGHNLASGDSTCAGFTVGDPNLGPLQDNGGPTKTMAISAPSAALDLIPVGAGCPATDQRGLARPQGLACDIGAFELVKRYSVSATKTGTGSGSISSSPASIDCGPACQGQFDQGTQITLTATADPDSRFAGWSGGGCSGTGPCTLTATADTTVIAAFKTTPAPNTKIGKAKIDSDAGTATFTFGTTAKARAASGFQCALVSKKHRKPKFKGCTSPKKYKHLKHGKYKFEVRAFDDAGTDSTPAKQKFKIV